jgi:hypothetical protein
VHDVELVREVFLDLLCRLGDGGAVAHNLCFPLALSP